MIETSKEVRSVLYIEDNPLWQRAIRRLFGKKIRLVIAPTIDAGWKAYREDPRGFTVIVFDGSVPIYDLASLPLDVANMVDLAREIRKTYTGMMFAASSDEEMNVKLLAAGCNSRVQRKMDIIKLVTDVLGL